MQESTSLEASSASMTRITMGTPPTGDSDLHGAPVASATGSPIARSAARIRAVNLLVCLVIYVCPSRLKNISCPFRFLCGR